MLRRSLILVALLSVVGCQSGIIPDPNDPADRQIEPEILQRNLAAVSDALMDRRLKREIDNVKFRELISKAASELVNELDLRSIEADQAWRYGDVLRAARNWEAASEVLKVAVKYAKASQNEDRRVNDTLRLAHVQAQMGKVDEALVTADEVMDAKPGDSAPILLAMLYEVLPAARGKGHDVELAELMQKAIYKHERTKVDTSAKPGQDFMTARPFHIEQSYVAIAALYSAAGKHELSQEAAQKAIDARADFTSFLRQELAAAPPTSPKVNL